MFWPMAWGAVAIWLGVMGLAAWATLRAPGDRKTGQKLIYAGALIPAVVLAGLLLWGLLELPVVTARAPANSLVVSVNGEQWWWRFRVEPPSGQPFETANELWLPVGQPVEFRLSSDNVIHSFWIPELAGKIDLIPGRVNYLTIRPDRAGRFRGVCAEFCGVSHANMAFEVNVVSRGEFDEWVRQQVAPAEGAQP